MSFQKLPASFRDPSGHLFRSDGVLYRQINDIYRTNYDLLNSSGLYAELADPGSLIKHNEVRLADLGIDDGSIHKIIQPQIIPYISYPYEWSFSQLKDAALLTLDVQKKALARGMVLKDASAYNVQFIGSNPVFIDTLSFVKYEAGEPWVAYRQFCQHFLGPLALMSNRETRLSELLKNFIDGIPLDLVSRLLPKSTFLKYGLLTHIHLHSSSQRRHQDTGRDAGPDKARPSLSKSLLLALMESLENAVAKCSPPTVKTEWGDYYNDTNYSSDAMNNKEETILEIAAEFIGPNDTIHDIGGNTGRFSHLVATPNRYVVSHDIDTVAVEHHYTSNKRRKIDNVLPLLLDLNNPSPDIGWNLEERDSALKRMESDVVMALALVHHLAISNNVPLDLLAKQFHRIARTLIIEFVPKEDSQVRRLLATREDVFPDYDIRNFESSLKPYFNILSKRALKGTERTLFVAERI